MCVRLCAFLNISHLFFRDLEHARLTASVLPQYDSPLLYSSNEAIFSLGTNSLFVWFSFVALILGMTSSPDASSSCHMGIIVFHFFVSRFSNAPVSPDIRLCTKSPSPSAARRQELSCDTVREHHALMVSRVNHRNFFLCSKHCARFPSSSLATGLCAGAR